MGVEVESPSSCSSALFFFSFLQGRRAAASPDKQGSRFSTRPRRGTQTVRLWMGMGRYESMGMDISYNRFVYAA